MTERSATAMFVGPLLVLMVVAFDLPLLAMLWDSVAASGAAFAPYRELGQSALYLRVVANTAGIAGAATVGAVVLGYPLAYWIWRQPASRRPWLLGLVILPYWISILVRSFAWMVLLGREGIVNRALVAAGIADQPFEFLFAPKGVIIGMVNILLPFVVLPLYAAMAGIDTRLLAAAATLGASPGTIFRRVFLPQTLPALAAAAVLVFILGLGFYVTPALLGGGRVPMIANLIDILVLQIPRWPVAAALSALLLAGTLALYALYRRLEPGR